MPSMFVDTVAFHDQPCVNGTGVINLKVLMAYMIKVKDLADQSLDDRPDQKQCILGNN